MPGSSVGYTSAINGGFGSFNPFVANPKNSGGAINGFIAKQTQNLERRYPEFQQIRFTLKNAWNTTYPSQIKELKLKRAIITPFRAVNNAGDLLARDNYSCGGPCQTPQYIPNVYGLKQRFGSTSKSCQPTGIYNSLQSNKSVPSATCNVRYVYDSSDYITYLKQQAIAKNYNDLSFGGDQSNASQVAGKAARRNFG